MTVSRETDPSDGSSPPPVPIAARGVFPSDRLALVERYATLLATDGVVRGLIGPREGPRLWDRHLLNSVVLQETIPPDASVCDIGSGAGLPGLVVALARPDVRMTLVEPLLRRTTFLDEVVSELSLDNVEVVRGRAESLHGRRTFDVVTSRAVAPLPRLLEWSMPLVAPAGALVALKGGSLAEEIEAAGATLERMACATPVLQELGVAVLEAPVVAVRVAWADPSAVRWSTATERTSSSGTGRRSSRRAGGRPSAR